MRHSDHLTLSPRAYGAFLSEVQRLGEPSSPRGIQTRELVGASVTLRNPLDRIVTARARRSNLAFGLAEWFSFMLGIDEVAYFQRFIRDYGRFSSDGQHLDGCYGARVHYATGGLDSVQMHSQLLEVIHVLERDPDSRQAVISIYDRRDLFGLGGKNTPCTLDLQFLTRDNRLHLITYMRSSDAYKGITYDVLVFTLVQEFVARALGLELGTYLHRAGSLHLYQEDVKHIDPILESPRWPLTMGAMPRLAMGDLERARVLLGVGLPHPDEYQQVVATVTGFSSGEAQRYLLTLTSALVAFAARRDFQDHSAQAYHHVHDRTLRYVLRPWLVDAGVLTEARPPGRNHE